MLGIHRIGVARADYYLGDLAAELPVPGAGRWAAARPQGSGSRVPWTRSGSASS